MKKILPLEIIQFLGISISVLCALNCSQGFTKIESVKKEGEIKKIEKLNIVYARGDVDESFVNSFKNKFEMLLAKSNISFTKSEKSSLSLKKDMIEADSLSWNSYVIEIKLDRFTTMSKSFKVDSHIKNRLKEKIWASKMEVPMSYIYLVVAGFPNPSGSGSKGASKLFSTLKKDGMF